ncbi:hypothetical protein [Actinoplanes xinjiangensis]|uniref:Lipoprotein n=1 Tax=Actinoplanes xinjiangensis TaxID=512350 RepID=A0A316ER05_9ACTN|nr:hypothetical protein [Actinoplanes xinjiangensis]PWK33314.1 hypothetical protein BC793_128104 [Actinoplanes xinjiangensis]
MSFRKMSLLLAASVAVLTVTACGSEPEPQTTGAEVATLQSAPVGAPASAASAATGDGAVIRPDASSAEIHDLERAYFKCLRDNGAPSSKDGVTEPGRPSPAPETVRAAEVACADKQPVSWFDVERRTNPEFPDLLRTAAGCLKKKGFQARVVETPQWRLAYRDSGEFMRAGDTEAQCVDEAFAARIKTYR